MSNFLQACLSVFSQSVINESKVLASNSTSTSPRDRFVSHVLFDDHLAEMVLHFLTLPSMVGKKISFSLPGLRPSSSILHRCYVEACFNMVTGHLWITTGTSYQLGIFDIFQPTCVMLRCISLECFCHCLKSNSSGLVFALLGHRSEIRIFAADGTLLHYFPISMVGGSVYMVINDVLDQIIICDSIYPESIDLYTQRGIFTRRVRHGLDISNISCFHPKEQTLILTNFFSDNTFKFNLTTNHVDKFKQDMFSLHSTWLLYDTRFDVYYDIAKNCIQILNPAGQQILKVSFVDLGDLQETDHSVDVFPMIHPHSIHSELWFAIIVKATNNQRSIVMKCVAV